MSSDNTPLFGGCQCGAIRYELSHGPLQLYVCHCTECRKQSASAFGISFIVPQTALRLTQGEPRLLVPPYRHGKYSRLCVLR